MITFFHRMGMKAKTAAMAKWGRRHYGITEQNDKKAIRQLAVILMGKERTGAFKPVSVRRNRKIKSKPVSVVIPGNVTSRVGKKKDGDFYESWEWKRVRYEILKEHGAKCMLCGATKEDGAKICVDHVKPRARYPHLELEKSNLQVLCNDCNMGKGRWDETDWR